MNRKYRGKIVVDPEFVKAYRRYKGLTEPGRLEYLKELGARQAANRKAGWAAMTPEARAAFMARLHAGRDAYWERERARKDALRRKLAEEPDTSSRPVRKTVVPAMSFLTPSTAPERSESFARRRAESTSGSN